MPDKLHTGAVDDRAQGLGGGETVEDAWRGEGGKHGREKGRGASMGERRGGG